MAKFAVLDSGPLSEVAKLGGGPAAAVAFARLRKLATAGMSVVIAEVADYEVRRELLRSGKTAGVRRLDQLRTRFEFVPITSDAMRLAAGFWADARRAGRPTSHPHALDGDAILAAQATNMAGPGDRAVVVTTNVGHLARFIETLDWDEID